MPDGKGDIDFSYGGYGKGGGVPVSDWDELNQVGQQARRVYSDPNTGDWNELNQTGLLARQPFAYGVPPRTNAGQNLTPTNNNTPPPQHTDFFQSIANSFGVTKQSAELIVGGGIFVLALALFAAKKH